MTYLLRRVKLYAPLPCYYKVTSAPICVPNKRCVRVREGGEALQTIGVDRGCFACMLGGHDRRTLFLIAAEWRGMDRAGCVAYGVSRERV